MRVFLRYQISGNVFIIWLLLLYFGHGAETLEEIISKIKNSFDAEFIVTSVFFGFPIGAIIHQISVNIKNWIFGKKYPVLRDYDEEFTLKIIRELNNKGKKESIKYILEHLSNLNSFFYVRFENGFLSPLLAMLSVLALLIFEEYCISLKFFINIFIFIIISVILFCYGTGIIKRDNFFQVTKFLLLFILISTPFIPSLFDNIIYLFFLVIIVIEIELLPYIYTNIIPEMEKYTEELRKYTNINNSN